MDLTYRTRRTLKRAGVIALAVVLASTLVWGCWLIWVERHIVYTRDGAVLDFGVADTDYGEGQVALPPEDRDPVTVFYNDGFDVSQLDTSLRQMSGYYITADMLSGDLETIRATIAALPVGTAVMMEVKSIKGTFYYTTNIDGAPTSSALDITAVDQLIADIASRNLYLIASVPAFRDRNFGLENIASGLPYIGGQGALWLDSTSCYWMNPTSKGAMEFLTRIAEELRNLGFDEVLFTDFRFPDSPEIDFSGNRITAIQSAAEQLVASCATERFAVSFQATGSTVQPVTGRSRLYLTDVEAANAAAAAAGYAVDNPAVNIAFLTNSYDTRYESWTVLRPMDSAVPQ